MWHGDPALVGNTDGDLWNFKECDGSNITSFGVYGPDGTLYETPYGGSQVPDLRGRFPLGADGSSYIFGTQQGSDSTPIGVANLPNHRHKVNLRTGSGNSSQIGNSAANNNARTDDGAHQHQIRANDGGNGSSGNRIMRTTGSDHGNAATYYYDTFDTGNNNNTGTHVHEVEGWTDEAGGASSAQNIEIMPPYHVLTYIIRIV